MLRLEVLGACYQVSNRGNDRRHVFRTVGAQIAFETCLFEACAKSGSVLHAFVIMGNHHHLVVETSAGKLVAGMQWLQATFANRFNRQRGECGLGARHSDIQDGPGQGPHSVGDEPRRA